MSEVKDIELPSESKKEPFEIHIEAPCSGLIVGNSGSGKTTLVRHLLKHTFKEQFDEIFIICPTMNDSGDYKHLEDNPKFKKRMFDEFDSGLIDEIIDAQRAIIKKYGKKRTPQVLILLDDLLDKVQGNSNIINKCFWKARHWNISIFLLVQRLHGIGTIIRTNARFVIFFRTANSNELENLLAEYTGKAEKSMIQNKLFEWFQQSWSFMVCDMKNQDFSKRYALGKDCKLYDYIDYYSTLLKK